MKLSNTLITAIAVSTSLLGTVTATADPLTPWEKFCLNTSKPGKDLGNCLDGVPSQVQGPASMTNGGGQSAAIAIRRNK